MDTASRKAIALHLVDIVGAEGPMHARRAFQLYVRGAGGSRVGREIQRVLSSVLGAAVNAGELARISDSVGDSGERTVYLPDTEPVVVRVRGSRDLVDIPRSEIRSLITTLELDGCSPELIKREVLTALGLARQTAKASSYLDECLRYEWSV